MREVIRLRGRLTSKRKHNKQRNRAVKHINTYYKRLAGHHSRWIFLGQEYTKCRCYWDTAILNLPYDEAVHCPHCTGDGCLQRFAEMFGLEDSLYEGEHP